MSHRPSAQQLLGACALLLGITLVVVAAVQSGNRDDRKDTAVQPPRLVDGPVLAFGGDVNLGRRQNAVSAARGPRDALAIPALADADLAVVNLESVVASVGEPAEKGEEGPYYFRGRPETLAVLRAAGVDMVATANNHSGDYGTPALLQQGRLLARMGMGQAGSGNDVDGACAPSLRRVDGLVVALFSLDATMPFFAATEDRPGTCHVSPDDPASWAGPMAPRIAAVREAADIVVVALHAGANYAEAPESDEVVGSRALIDAGADAVLGSSAHVLHGIELYRDRPIVYDAGNLLFDFQDTGSVASAVFSLVLSTRGVEQVRVHPVVSEYGATRPADGQEAQQILTTLVSGTAELGSTLLTDAGTGYLDIGPLPARGQPNGTAPPDPAVQPAPGPLASPPPQCVARRVPPSARVVPRRIGPLTLVGAAVEPARLEERGMVWVDTYWRASRQVGADLWLSMTGAPAPESAMQPWRGDHEPCDWMWPTSRWEPGVIHHDRYGLRPPDEVASARLEVQVGVLAGGRLLGSTSLTERVDVAID